MALKVRPLRFNISHAPRRRRASRSPDSPHLGFWRELGACMNFELSHRPAPFRIDLKNSACVVEPLVGAGARLECVREPAVSPVSSATVR